MRFGNHSSGKRGISMRLGGWGQMKLYLCRHRVGLIKQAFS